MKKATITAAVMVMLLFGNWIEAGISGPINGSFEDDGLIIDIRLAEPNGWKVNIPDPGKFGGYVDTEWVTDGSFNLTVYSQWWTTFEVNDMATVWQEVYLTDVKEISFDLKVHAYLSTWDENKCTAVFLIDEDVVWNSDEHVPDANGEYRGQVVDIDVRDKSLHKLSLGIRVDVNEVLYDYYKTQWDSVKFSLHCGDSGFPPGDFDRDCCVDMNDLGTLVQTWLEKVDPNDECNLSGADDVGPYGIINFLDFAIYADSWDGNMPDLKTFVDVWLDEIEVNNKYNLFRDDDVDAYGIVNFLDFAVFADNWMRNCYGQQE